MKQYAETHYKYDARSNLIEKQQGEQITKFSWDGFNRLSKISSQAGEIKYFYDVFGRRIGKENAQGKTEFIWDGDVIALEKTAEHTRHYLFEPNSFIPLAQIVEKGESSHAAYYHVDHLGTPQTLSDENGEIAWSAEYKAWGEAQVVISEAAKTAGINNPIRFQGQYFDEESGLHYNRHRYYDPEIGRFISSDPIGLMGGFNTHAYAPNPTGWVDPFGLSSSKCPCDCDRILAEMNAKGRQSGQYNQVDPDSHHIIQNAAMQDIPGYSRSTAPAVQLQGPSTTKGSEHYIATQTQREAGGGNYAAERRIGYKAMRKAGITKEQARCLIMRSDEHFTGIGVTPQTKTRTVGNRRK